MEGVILTIFPMQSGKGSTSRSVRVREACKAGLGAPGDVTSKLSSERQVEIRQEKG